MTPELCFCCGRRGLSRTLALLWTGLVRDRNYEPRTEERVASGVGCNPQSSSENTGIILNLLASIGEFLYIRKGTGRGTGRGSGLLHRGGRNFGPT